MTKGRINLLTAGIIALLLLSSFSVFTTIRDGRRIDRAVALHERQDLWMETATRFQAMASLTKTYAISWTYLPSDSDDKNNLRLIQSTRYREFKERTEYHAPAWPPDLRRH